MGPFRARTHGQGSAQGSGERKKDPQSSRHWHDAAVAKHILPKKTFLQLFYAMCVNVARKNLYTHYSQVTSMAKNGRGAVEAGREAALRGSALQKWGN